MYQTHIFCNEFKAHMYENGFFRNNSSNENSEEGRNSNILFSLRFISIDTLI